MNDYTTASLPAFSPSGVSSAVTGGIFYLAMAAALLYSIASIYALIRYSDSKAIAFIASVIYGIIFLSLFGTGVHTLLAIK